MTQNNIVVQVETSYMC